MPSYRDLFTRRQLTALTTFSDLVGEARERVLADALGARASGPPEHVHSRGYLPHWEAGERPQHITFRLADSLPNSGLHAIDATLAALPEANREAERRKRIDAALDVGEGACWMRQPAIAALVEQALRHFDGDRYRLHEWVIMPNHVHVLMTPLAGHSLSSILHSWKSFTAKEANRLLGRDGQFWMEEYFDRLIRDEAHYARAATYVRENPVKAKLCAAAEDWPYSSAAKGREREWERARPARTRTGRPLSDEVPLHAGGTGATAYADAVATYLALIVSRLADRCSNLCSWDIRDGQGRKSGVRNVFSRQAIPMTWDFVEAYPLSEIAASLDSSIGRIYDILQRTPNAGQSELRPIDAAKNSFPIRPIVISTDPPYYDNIGYADLSDFFYVWLRRSLQGVWPDLFRRLLTPKEEELVATLYRHGGRAGAEKHFMRGMAAALRAMRQAACDDVPLTVYYAFKQSEAADEGVSSAGWSAFLQAVVDAELLVDGTWPLRTELGNRMISMGTNALASSVVLVCRKRPATAATITRAEFLRALKRELPDALVKIRAAGIQAVDFQQAAIGPGMGVFSRYARVLEADDSPPWEWRKGTRQ